MGNGFLIIYFGIVCMLLNIVGFSFVLLGCMCQHIWCNLYSSMPIMKFYCSLSICGCMFGRSLTYVMILQMVYERVEVVSKVMFC